VTLRTTKPYDFYDPKDRGEWLDIVIALIEYLRSGDSKVGYLNNQVLENMLHKDGSQTEEISSQNTRVSAGRYIGKRPSA
jgi:hypothetical protein